MKNYITLLLLMCSLSVWGQSPVSQALQNYRSNYLPEKVFVHTDKNLYAAGETLWMAVYLVDGQSHRPGAFSTFVRVQLLDGKGQSALETKVFAPGGTAAVSLDIPRDLQPDRYRLLAYTNYQRNTGEENLFSKEIQVIEGIFSKKEEIGFTEVDENRTKQTLNIRFFPEGGDCVVGMPCIMAIQADKDGFPALAQGTIEPIGGAPIALFKTDVNGLGKLSFVPQAGQRYVARLAGNPMAEGIDLPEILPQGYALQVRHTKEDVQLVMRSNQLSGLQGAKILVHHRGLLFLEEKLFTSGNATLMRLPYEDMSPGVHIATLFGKDGEPVAERLFFVAPSKEESQVKISIQDTDIAPKQELSLDLSASVLKQGEDSLLKGSLSMAVLPLAANLASTDDIRTWLLLNSDVDFPVPFADNVLFAQDGKRHNTVLDQYLMTRGWRRFRWKNIMNKEKFEASYPLDRGLMITGQMTQFDAPSVPRPGKVFLNQMNYGIFEESLTEADGTFSMGPFFFFDTTEVILQGRYKTGKKKKQEITIEDKAGATLRLIEEKDSPNLPSLAPYQRLVLNESLEADYRALSHDKLLIDTYGEIKEVTLEEIEIKAKNNFGNSRAMYSGNPSYRLVVDSIQGGRTLTSIRELLVRIPGIQILNGKITVQGPTDLFEYQDTEPTYMLDGTQTDLGTLQSIPVRDIDFIDLLKGPDATEFGVRGANGVILVYSRIGYTTESVSRTPGILTAKVPGFHKAREFAAFDETKRGQANWRDIRTTLHWNPSIELPSKGSAKEAITTSEQSGTYVVIVQGLRKNGQPLYGVGSFEVKE